MTIQVINGKRYNTDTATELGSFDNGLGRGDFGHVSETLYRTKKGAFFLDGEGGPNTSWAESVGNMRGGSAGIRTLSTAEALNWAETHRVSPDTIAEHFDIEEG